MVVVVIASAITIVVVVVPVSLRMPAMLILVPPSTIRPVASLPFFMELMARFVRLPALVTVVFNGFVQPVVCVRNAALAIVVCMQPGHSGQRQKAGQRHCRKRPLSEQ
jgi:hypothetical protein